MGASKQEIETSKQQTKQEGTDMMKIEFNAMNEKEERAYERELKGNGFRKTADCMWVKIYEKENVQVVLSREY